MAETARFAAEVLLPAVHVSAGAARSPHKTPERGLHAVIAPSGLRRHVSERDQGARFCVPGNAERGENA